MTKFIPIIIFSILFSMVSCASDEEKPTKIEVKVEPTPVIQKVVKQNLEKLPAELAQKIFSECNSVDITLYNSDKSVSLWNDNVKHVTTTILGEAPQFLNKNIDGHLMLLKDGNALAFVEISLSENNNYVVYTIDKKKYYSVINEKGIEFFNRFL